MGATPVLTDAKGRFAEHVYLALLYISIRSLIQFSRKPLPLTA